MRGLVGSQHPDGIHDLPPLGFVGGGELVDADAQGVGPVDDLVLDVGDVGDIGHVEPGEEQVPPQDVEDQGEPSVSQVGHPVDGRTAHVHGDPAGHPQPERRDLAGGGVVERQHAGYGNPIMTTDATGATDPMAGPSGIPEKPGLEGLEAAWSARWDAAGTYTFDRTAARAQVYSIDTPPPTVSGSLHIGHVFSYTHTDAMARFHRMRGRRPSSTPWVGTTTGSPPSAGSRTTSGSVATRASPSTPPSRRRPNRPRTRSPSRAPTSWRSATS